MSRPVPPPPLGARLSKKVNVADRGPGVPVGENSIPKVQELPDATEPLVHVSEDTENWPALAPVVVALETVRLDGPLLVRVTVCSVLVVPMTTLPKAREFGATSRSRYGAVPWSGAAPTSAGSPALQWNSNRAEKFTSAPPPSNTTWSTRNRPVLVASQLRPSPETARPAWPADCDPASSAFS